MEHNTRSLKQTNRNRFRGKGTAEKAEKISTIKLCRSENRCVLKI